MPCMKKKKKTLFIQYTSVCSLHGLEHLFPFIQSHFEHVPYPLVFKWYCVALKVLGVSEEPGGVSDELHEVHHLPHLPPLPLHRGVCPAWHAALWWQVTH